MIRFIRPRLRVPLTTAGAGMVVAAAVAVGPGSRAFNLVFALMIVALAAGLAINQYIRAAKDTDLGAIYGSRAENGRRASNSVPGC